MKKCLILLTAVCTLFFSCTNNKEKLSEYETQIAELKKINQKLTDENNNLKQHLDSIISSNKKQINFSNDGKYDVHKLEFTLQFTNDGYKNVIYKNPETTDPVYMIQAGDTLNVLRFITDTETEKSFIEVEIPYIAYGFIPVTKNPYQNKNFSYIETVSLNNKTIDCLKLDSAFSVRSGSSLYALPYTNAELVYTVLQKNSETYFYSMEITADYKWVKVNVDGYEGWTYASNLSVDRGGPVINTPEEVIKFQLIGQNEL